MTSKSPVRSAEDVDEAALSYAEIKALATGNPIIIEKSNLEMEVGKLKLLQASHLSQKYELEDKILKEYPREIKYFEERIAGYKSDIEKVAVHTPADKEEFPPMVIHGVTYTEKADAGNALIVACKQMASPDSIPIGSYRGFEMELFFETVAKEYRMNLKGTMCHTVSLGSDIHGNITRLNNVLEGFEPKLQSCKEKLDGIVSQMDAAKIEVDNPFPQENELHQKTERLNELNVLLNMDEKDHTLIDGEPETGDDEPERDRDMAR